LLAFDDKGNFSQKIIVREWVGIPVEYEVVILFAKGVMIVLG